MSVCYKSVLKKIGPGFNLILETNTLKETQNEVERIQQQLKINIFILFDNLY